VNKKYLEEEEKWIQSDFFKIWEKLARNENIDEIDEKSVIYKESKYATTKTEKGPERK